MKAETPNGESYHGKDHETLKSAIRHPHGHFGCLRYV